jgi:polyhydroxybutyrate depolymerase
VSGKQLSSGAILRRLALVVTVVVILGGFVARRSASAADPVVSIAVGGRTRTAVVHVPPGYTGAAPVPLVLLLHGGGGNGEQAARAYRMDPVADRENFIVAYPNGTSRMGNMLTWNAANCCGYAQDQGVDDVAFIRALIDELGRRYAIDPRRIYATGMSNGGMMTYRLACQLSDRLAAIAPVAGALNETSCAPVAPVPAIIFHGTDDQQVLYDGGYGPRQFEPRYDFPVSHAVSFFVAHNDCSTAPVTETSPSGAIKKETYGNGTGGAEVIVYTVVGGGHAWPGGVPPTRPGADAPTQEISASELMWAFFERHPKAGPAVRVTGPNGGETVRRGETVSISWEIEDGGAATAYDIWLSADGGASYTSQIAAGLAPTERSFSWTVGPDVAKGKRYRVRVTARAADGSAVEDASDGDFRVKKR